MLFGDLESQLIVVINVIGVEGLQVDEVGTKMVDDGAKPHSVAPRRRHVDDGQVVVALRDDFAPFL